MLFFNQKIMNKKLSWIVSLGLLVLLVGGILIFRGIPRGGNPPPQEGGLFVERTDNIPDQDIAQDARDVTLMEYRFINMTSSTVKITENTFDFHGFGGIPQNAFDWIEGVRLYSDSTLLGIVNNVVSSSTVIRFQYTIPANNSARMRIVGDMNENAPTSTSTAFRVFLVGGSAVDEAVSAAVPIKRLFNNLFLSVFNPEIGALFY